MIDYRRGNSPVFYPIKMPGLGKVGNVTMRKGIFTNDQKFWTWFSADQDERHFPSHRHSQSSGREGSADDGVDAA